MRERRHNTFLARLVLALMPPAILLGVPIAVAQSANFAPHGHGGATVSLRELKIPCRARDEFEQGRSRLFKYDFAGSLRHFAAAVRLFPNYYEAYYLQGVANTQLHRDDEALQEFQAAIDSSDGRYGRAQFGYALVLQRQGHAAEAEPIARLGLETEPDNPDGHVVLGLVLLELNRADEAEKSVRKALQLNDPRGSKAYLVLADLHAARRDYQAQFQDLSMYIKLNPRDPGTDFFRTARDVAKRMSKEAAARSAASVARAER